ncbi:MAG: GWxTD domain-containing protein [Candidatus Aminicenantes bacterium]
MIQRKISPLLFFFLILWLPLQPGFSQQASSSEEKKIEPLSQWSKQWLEEVVPYIITDVEKKIFINLPTEEERGKFIHNFWKKRDPDPNTAENEFKLEYYKRIALANKFFGASGIDGWRTDRGKIYILLGPPNEIQRDMSPSGSAFHGFHGPREVWNYWGLPNPRLPYNLEFVFVDKLGTGNYVLERSLKLGDAGSTHFDIDSMHSQFDYMEIMAEATRNPFEDLDKLRGIITTQVTYDHIPLQYDVFYLKGPQKRTHIPLAIEIPYSALTQKEIEGEYYFSLTVLIEVSNKLGQIIFEKSRDINLKHKASEIDSLSQEAYQFQTSLSLQPESYKIHLLVLDNFSGKIGTVHQEFSVPSFSSQELTISDILLSSEKITNGIKAASQGEKEISTKITHNFRPDEEMTVYFEVYNLTLSPETGLNDFQIEYSFLHDEKLLARVPSPESKPTSEEDCSIRSSFRLKNFKPGSYLLRIKVTDRNSGKVKIKDNPFSVSGRVVAEEQS